MQFNLGRFLALLCIFSTVAIPALRADEVELRSIYARNYNLNQIVNREGKASVFIFAREGCPAVDLVAKSLAQLHAEYSPKGINFYMIYSYSGTSIRDMARHTQALKIPIRALLDVNQELAKKWEIKRTATVAMLSSTGTLLYKGAIKEGDRNGSNKAFFLKEAIEQWLRDKKVTVQETSGQGCVINTKRRIRPKGLTFYKDIQPIIQAKCQRCHHAGEVAPMELVTYEDVFNNSSMIAQVVEDRLMPPWPAESKHKIKDNAALSNLEIDQLLGWIEDDMPEGNLKDKKPDPVWPNAKQWVIGKPDLLFETRSFTVPEEGIVPYIYTRRAIEADQDLFLTALEVKPGARRVVHHMAIHEFPYGTKPITAVDLIKIYGLEISNTILGAYVPGIQPRILPPGHGIRIKKGMGILVDAHYTPTGKKETDVTQIGFKVSTKAPEREVYSRWFYRSRGRFLIPSGVDHIEMVRDDISFKNDIEIMGVRPHLHARGKSFSIEKINFSSSKPGEEVAEPVLSLPRWDFNWQYDFVFDEPLRLKGGESLRIIGSWDNTDFNPTNPDPKQPALFGEQTQDEMMGVLLLWRDAKKEDK